MFKIGPYELAEPWILAPMAGVSEMPFRVLARRLGAAAAPTELVSAKGLVYGQERTRRYLTHDPSETPFWVQIFGGDPDSMAEGAAHAVALGAAIIDVNMGCPVKKVTRNGAGSALLCDPIRAAGIVRAIERRTGVPVTAKIRSGWDAHSINAVEMTRALADAGCRAIAVHGRTRAQGYSGRADWDVIARMVEMSPIPVIGNGDVRSAADGHRMLACTGCAGVMIGRAALGNPWIFSQVSRGAARPPPSERWLLIREHLSRHRAFVGEDARAIRSFRQHLMWYAHGLTGAAAFRRRAVTLSTASEIEEIAEEFFSAAERDASHGHVQARDGDDRVDEVASDGYGSLPGCDTRAALG